MKFKVFKMTKAFLLVFIAFSFASCAVVKTHTTKTSDVYGAGVIQKPVIADLDVKETKVTGTALSTSSQLLASIKNEAVYDALKTANADILVEPRFETETTNGKTKVTVTGYPATYKNFRSATDKDTTVLKIGIIQRANLYEPAVVNKKKGNGVLVVLSVILTVGLIGILSGGL